MIQVEAIKNAVEGIDLESNRGLLQQCRNFLATVKPPAQRLVLRRRKSLQS